MAVEMARELQALAGGRRTRAVKQQKVVHAPRAAVAANAASSSTPRALISSYFVARTPVLAATPPPPAAASGVTPATAPVPAPCTIPPDGGCVAHTTDPPEAPAPCLICLEVIDPQATGNSACLTLPCQHHFHGECLLKWAVSAQSNRGTCPSCRASVGGSGSAPADAIPTSPLHPYPSAKGSVAKEAAAGLEEVTTSAPTTTTTEPQAEPEVDATRSTHGNAPCSEAPQCVLTAAVRTHAPRWRV